MTEKNTYTYVAMARNSGWRSEAEGSLNSSGQFAGSSPIPQIVPTQDTAMNARPSAFLVEAVGAEHYQKEFRRFFGESNARPAVGRSNGDITRSKSKFELVSKVWTDPFSTPSRLRGRWIWYRRKSRRFRDRRGVQCIQTHGL